MPQHHRVNADLGNKRFQIESDFIVISDVDSKLLEIKNECLAGTVIQMPFVFSRRDFPDPEFGIRLMLKEIELNRMRRGRGRTEKGD